MCATLGKGISVMRYRLHLTAYDIADRVYVSWRLFDDQKDPDSDLHEVLERAETLQGVGESNPKLWMQEVAEAILRNS